MVREAVDQSILVSETVRSAGEAGIDMVADLVNHIAVGVIPAEWDINTTINCKAKGDALEIGNYKGLKLTDQILEIVQSVIEKLIRQQVDNY